MLINVLTPGFTTSNGSAFLFPFVVHKNVLREAGITVNFVSRSTPGLTDCDVLAIDSKEFRNDMGNESQSPTVDLISSYRRPDVRVLWFDTTDSTGTLQSQVFPVVDRYLKSQILVDKSRYASRIYGGRIYSEYYKNSLGIEDETGSVMDRPISNEYIPKLGVSWNSGLSDYSVYGPLKVGMYRRTGLSFLLRHPRKIEATTADRSIDLSVRFGVTHSRATVRYQREKLRHLLSDRLDTNKLGRRGYMKELVNSKIVVSPFGWGEITLKDFEVFLTGGMLLKPSLTHMQTWPEFYENDVTYMSHDWDLDTIEERIDWALSNNSKRLEIAEQGQRRYIQHTSGPTAGRHFVNHLLEIVSP
jgi:hypothetical protein